MLLIVSIISFNEISAQDESLNDLDTYKETAIKITSTSLEGRNTWSMLRDFCSMGPRLSGSENSLKAIHWAESKMKELGLENIYLQPVMVPHWERGKVEQAEITGGEYSGRKISICALGGSIGTEKEGITAPLFEVKNLDEIEGTFAPAIAYHGAGLYRISPK